MNQVEVKILGLTITAQYGTLNTGDILRTNAEFAKHLVEDCKAAEYISVQPEAPKEPEQPLAPIEAPKEPEQPLVPIEAPKEPEQPPAQPLAPAVPAAVPAKPAKKP